MTDEQKEKARADMERSVDRMRDKLVEVCTIAVDALKEMRETESLGDKWRKLSSALGTLRSKLRPEPGTLAWAIEIDWYVDHEPRLRWTSETGGGTLYAAGGRGRGPGESAVRLCDGDRRPAERRAAGSERAEEGRRAGAPHVESRGGLHPHGHGVRAAELRGGCDGAPDGREQAYDAAFPEAAQLGASACREGCR